MKFVATAQGRNIPIHTAPSPHIAKTTTAPCSYRGLACHAFEICNAGHLKHQQIIQGSSILLNFKATVWHDEVRKSFANEPQY